MKLENKVAIGALTLIGSVILATNIGDDVDANCETYRGHTNNYADGETTYVFDEKTLANRGISRPNYSLIGNPEWHNDLERGEKYDLKIWEPTFPLVQKRLLSLPKPSKTCDENSQ